MIRTPPALLLALAALAGCNTTSAKDSEIAAVHLENAAQYYDTAHYDRAYQQWERVLALEPDEEKALLGQAMALYMMGRERSAEGAQKLANAEVKLDELRTSDALGDMKWKAELGYALVQERWAKLIEEWIRHLEADEKAGIPAPKGELEKSRAEFPRRIALAEKSFQSVLADPRSEPNFHMTCWLGLAHTVSLRGDWEGALKWARMYEAKVVESREFWKKQDDAFASRLFGAELQEAELRDVMANLLVKLGRSEEAERELDKLIAIQPSRADAYLNRGMLRSGRRAWDLARSDLKRFLELTNLPQGDPNSLEAAKALLVAEEHLAEEDRQ